MRRNKKSEKPNVQFLEEGLIDFNTDMTEIKAIATLNGKEDLINRALEAYKRDDASHRNCYNIAITQVTELPVNGKTVFYALALSYTRK